MAKRPPIKTLIICTAVLVIVLAVLAFLFSKMHTPKTSSIDIKEHPTVGNPDARIHIVAFEDLKCPNCGHFSLSIFPHIKEKYLDTGMAKYSLILLAFIQGSVPAGNAALCLHEQNRMYFFPFVEYLFQHQPPEEQDWATITTLLAFAKNSTPQADIEALTECIVTEKYRSKLQKNMEIASQAMNNRVSTPSVFINGQLVDPLTTGQIDRMIQELQ